MSACHCWARCGLVMIPQTGLALTGFSRYCPSSLDLTNFVVRECRGATARPSRSHRRGVVKQVQVRPGLAHRTRSGNLQIWDLKIQKFGINKKKHNSSQNPNQFCSKCRQGSGGLARKSPSRPHLVPFQAIFPWTEKSQNCLPIFLGGPMGQVYQSSNWRRQVFEVNSEDQSLFSISQYP